jgi:hypothetical protein
VIRAYLFAPVAFIVAARELETTVRATLSGLVPGLISAAIMLLAVILTRGALGDSLSQATRLLVLIAVGVGTYLAVLRLVSRDLFGELTDYAQAAARRTQRRNAVSTAG